MRIPLNRIGMALAVIAVIVVAGLAGRHYWSMIAGTPESGGAAIGGPFTLLDETGTPVTEADFQGRPFLVYFGYTYCPDVCPTTLTTIAEAIDLLGDKGRDIAVLFISVDPERDRPEDVGDYARAFHPQVVGLTGTAEQVTAAARAYRVYFAKAAQNPDDPEDYAVDHSAYTYLMGRDGAFLAHFSHNVSPEEMAARIAGLL